MTACRTSVFALILLVPTVSTTAKMPKPRTDAVGDPLPEGALLRLGTVRYRASGTIYGAALSPDGRILAAACDPDIVLFDLSTGKPRYLRETCVPHFSGGCGPLLAFSPDGKQLVNVTLGGNLRCWDLATGQRLWTAGQGKEPAKKEETFPAVAFPRGSLKLYEVWFPPHGKSIIAGTVNDAATSEDFVVTIDPSSGKILRRFRLVGGLTSTSADGRTLSAMDYLRKEVVLYDDRGKELRRFRHSSELYLKELCQGGQKLVTINQSEEIKIWDAATGRELRTIAAPANTSERRRAWAVCISPDGRTLFVGTHGGDILRWDLRTGAELAPLRGHKYKLTRLFPTSDGQTLISVGYDNHIQRWNLRTGKAVPAGEGYTWRMGVARSPDGRTLAVGDGTGRLEFWDAIRNKRQRVFSVAPASIFRACYSPDGKRLALGCSDGRVRLWDVAKERVAGELPPACGKEIRSELNSFEGLAWSPDSRFLVTSLLAEKTGMWDAATGKEIRQGSGYGASAFSPDGKTLVSGGGDWRLTFQDAATGKRRFALEETAWIEDVVFSPDGALLATCNYDGDIRLRDPRSGQVRKTFRGKEGAARVLSFSADGKWLASSEEELLRIWETATGAELLCRKGHEGRIRHISFALDGRTIVTASDDLTALVWTLRPYPEPGRKRSSEALWTDLAAAPAAAYRAQWELIDDPKSASDLLRQKMPPVRIDVSERHVRALLADLDSDDFRKRQAAGCALEEMESAAETQLRRALTETQSAEVQQRVQRLLDRLKREPSAADLRVRRAVQVMELCGTDDARRVLRDWAEGTAGIALTEQARAALTRLRKTEPRP